MTNIVSRAESCVMRIVWCKVVNSASTGGQWGCAEHVRIWGWLRLWTGTGASIIISYCIKSSCHCFFSLYCETVEIATSLDVHGTVIGWAYTKMATNHDGHNRDGYKPWPWLPQQWKREKITPNVQLSSFNIII